MSLRRRVGALGAAALCAATSCAGSSGGRDDATPSGSSSASSTASPSPDPATEAAVRALMAPYARQLKARIVTYTAGEGHIGVYLEPQPAWNVDAYVAALPLQAAAARAILAAVPTAEDADVCADGPWLPHKGEAEYSTATKVLMFRARLGRVPADLGTPAAVLRASLRDQAFDIYVDPKIQTESTTWRAARKAGQ